jgi:hypothetical protein
VAAASLAVVGAATPAIAAPSYTMTEFAAAIASPAVVYLETVYTGLVRDFKTNQPLIDSPITYNRRGSGFLINAAGDVVTSIDSVLPSDATVRQQMLAIVATKLVSSGKLDAAQHDTWVNSHMDTSVVTGPANGSKAAVKLFAQFNIAKGTLTGKPAVTGTVVGKSDSKNGDVALVKLDQANLPAVELAPEGPLATGTQLTVLGFDTPDADPRVGTYAVVSQAAQVVGEAKRDNATVYPIDKKLSGSFLGGLAVDANGRVVGVISNDPSGSANSRAITPVSSITPVLGATGAQNALNDQDKLYRAGLLAYFGGNYRTAVSDLDQVAKAVPANHVAATYKQNALDRQRIEGSGSTGGTTWWIPAVAAVGGILLTVAVGLPLVRLSRRRRRPDPNDWAPAPSYAPGPQVPVQAGPVPPWTPLGPVSAPPIPPPQTAPTGYWSSYSEPPIVAAQDAITTQPVSWPPTEALPENFAMATPPPEAPVSVQPTPPEVGETQLIAPPQFEAPPFEAASFEAPPPGQPRPSWHQGPTRRPVFEEAPVEESPEAQAPASSSPWMVPPQSQ